MLSSSEVLKEDSAIKEAAEWGLELISVLVLLCRYTKILNVSEKCSEAIHLELITTSSLVRTEYY